MNSLMIILALLTKHFICDFPLQRKYQLQHKGIYGHPGGLLHAGIHTIGTLLALSIFISVEMALMYGLLDGIIHYHVDWAKVKLNHHFHLTPTNDWFWITLGFDQYLHQLTYVLIVFLIIT